ncbi:MAG: chromosome segregation protein SMC [Coriobacteriia bacterium]
MHLKSLTLKGFKSFADRTKLSLEPGVTVVVGPNGSGKSNISDAVLWVLGEQSAKALRGAAMEDVIFAGSSGRQAVGVAEVDLVLDNTDGSLPLEFSEVVVTRRMYRSGESEYLVNGSPCRLMDVHDLLHDTGLGRDTHSIISQGRIDEILSSRPEDRRSLIEEAAGVLKHKKRKERALRKLTSMDVHMERARDVIAEIDRQLRPLQRQADKAGRHRELSDELRDLDLALAIDDLRALRGRWEGLEKRENEASAEIELARYRLEEKERELSKFQSLLEAKGLFVGDLGEQRRRLQSVLERLNSGLLLLEEKGKNLVSRLSELRGTVHRAQTSLTSRTGEVDQLAADRAAADAALRAHYATLGDLRRESEAARKDRIAAEEELAGLNAAIRRSRKEADDARADLAKVEQALAAFALESEVVASRLETVRTQRATAAAALSARRTRAQELDAALARSRKELALAESDVDRRVRVLESRRRDLDSRRDALAAMRAETLGLEEVDRAFETASPALAWVLAKERELHGVVGILSDLITVETGHEQAVERALGPDLYCVIVRTPQDAEDLVSHLTSDGAGDVSVLPLSSLPEVAKPAGARLSGLVHCPEEIRPAVEALLGDAVAVDTLSEALRRTPQAGTRAVTRDGHVVWPNGKVTVGIQSDAGSGVLARKRRINELRDSLQACTATVGEAESAAAEAEDAVAAAQQDALEVGQRLAALAGESESLREELGRLEQGLTDLDAEAKTLQARGSAITDRTAKDGPQQKSLTAAIEAADLTYAGLEEEAHRARERREDRAREEAAVADRLSHCQVDIATVSEREVHLKRRMAAAQSELAESTRLVDRSKMTEEALETLRARIEPIHDQFSALLEVAEGWAVRLRDRARFEAADSESLRETIHAAQTAVKDAQGGVEEQAEATHRVQLEKAQLELQVDAAVRRIVEDLATPLERGLETPPVDDREAVAERAAKLRRRVADMGPVNPVALDEFDALARRRDQLGGQLEDLQASKLALKKVVSAVDRKIRERFLETFEEVDRHFQAVFSLLFPGGSAALRLTDEEDPEETGIEVVAQPPGKVLKKMSLMSGGEKSLTALALLFAVYHTRPCPFYVLDEVEAALDDTNLTRFVAFVDTLRSRTQFVIVTHQRRTMEMADVLYGVSMQADGVTKVVSQRLERDRRPAGEPDDARAVV